MAKDGEARVKRPAAPPAALEASGILLALAGACLFSLKPILVKLSYGYEVDAVTQLVLRMGFALPLYLAMGLYALRSSGRRGEPRDLSGRTVALALAVGVLGYYVCSMLDFEGLDHITAQFERLLLYTYPTFVAIIGHLLFRERLTRAHLVSLGLTYAGLLLVLVEDLQSLGERVILGAGLVIACSITYALYMVLARPLIARMGSPLFTVVSMISGTSLLILHFLLSHPLSALAVPMPVVLISHAMAIVATFIPSLMVNEAIARIGPGPTSVVGGVGPIFTSIMAILIIAEPFTLAHAAGTLLVIAGVVVLTRRQN
jgi:drug/metabolite transporter (DMT)-like permease